MLALFPLAQQLHICQGSGFQPCDSLGHSSGVSGGHHSTRRTIQVHGGKKEKGMVPSGPDPSLRKNKSFSRIPQVTPGRCLTGVDCVPWPPKLQGMLGEQVEACRGED